MTARSNAVAVTLKYRKDTKRTYVFGTEDVTAPITALYVAKNALGDKPPKEIRVIVTPQ